MKKTKTKPFRIAVSGKTIDGREIPVQDIKEMAETYNPELYQARINMEHLLSIYPDSTFKAYGDVLSLEAKEEEINGEKVTSLYAVLEVTGDLKTLNSKHQKIFSSIEYRPNFRESGKAYLTGLAVTDTPASVGTEALKFTLSQEKTLNYSTSLEGEKLVSADEPATEEKKPLFNFRNLFKKDEQEKKTEDFNGFSEFAKSTEEGFLAVSESMNEMKTTITQLGAQAKEAQKTIELQQEAIESLQKLAKTPEDAAAIPDHTFSGAGDETAYERPQY